MMLGKVIELHSPQTIYVRKNYWLTTITMREQFKTKFSTQYRLFRMLWQVNVIGRLIAGGIGVPL
jgi:hypothetical protein